MASNKISRIKWIFRVILIILIILTLISAISLTTRLIDYIMLDEREVMLQSSFDAKLELFSVEYQGVTGEVVVAGTDGVSVVAPGTAVEYTLYLRNSDKVALDYELSPQITNASERHIPIFVRMRNSEGEYVMGDEQKWLSSEEASQIVITDTLKKESSEEYIFEWKWEYEAGNDSYDTLLGNLADEKTARISMRFDLYSVANTDIEINGGIMESGVGGIVISGGSLLLFVILCVTLIATYLIKRKSKTGSTNLNEEEN